MAKDHPEFVARIFHLRDFAVSVATIAALTAISFICMVFRRAIRNSLGSPAVVPHCPSCQPLPLYCFVFRMPKEVTNVAIVLWAGDQHELTKMISHINYKVPALALPIPPTYTYELLILPPN